METVTVWEWFFILLVFSIPIVNIIVFIAFSCGVGKPGIVNLCRACWIWFAVGLMIALLFSAL